MKGLPTGYNKDLQEDKEPVFDSEDTLASALEATRAVLAHVTLRPERTRQAASGLLLATDVADYLVARGVPFRQAHEIVGGMVRQLLEEGRDFEALSLEEWRALQRALRRRRPAGGHTGGLGSGAKDAAVHGAGRGARGAGRNATLARGGRTGRAVARRSQLAGPCC